MESYYLFLLYPPKAKSTRDDLLPPPIPQKKRDASPVFVRHFNFLFFIYFLYKSKTTQIAFFLLLHAFTH